MTATLADALSRFAPQSVQTADGARVHYRSAGHGAQVTHVLLHGIGSGAGSWLRQLQSADGHDTLRVLAWDAPGYGGSTHLTADAPTAADYAARVWAWLDALQVQGAVTLVGHSLGALMAASAAASQPARVAQLVLMSPARGYGNASAEDRDKKLSDRLATLAQLGPQGIADKRGGAMLSPAAPADLVAYLRSIMAAIDPAGYTQAARMLAGAELGADIARLPASLPRAVASGSADTITPPAGCQAVAREAGVPWQDLGPVGHACAVEAAVAVCELLSLPSSLPAKETVS